MYRTESLVQYFLRLAFLNFIFNFILSCFFLYLKVHANEAECKQMTSAARVCSSARQASPSYKETGKTCKSGSLPQYMNEKQNIHALESCCNYPSSNTTPFFLHLSQSLDMLHKLYGITGILKDTL